MLATINTDASYSNKERIGAFAFWISTDAGRLKRGGILKGTVTDSEEAELKSIANALYLLFDRRSELPGISRVIVNTDCKYAINKISRGMAPKNENVVYMMAYWVHCFCLQLKRKYDINVEFRYVEAHRFSKGTKWDTSRHAVNEWCDRTAKFHMGHALLNVGEVRLLKPTINIKKFVHGTSARKRNKHVKSFK